MRLPPSTATFEIELPALRSWFGIGVAGNFAGHLEQAGEASDFINVEATETAPKGLFPFYTPGHDSFLSVFPLSHDTIARPSDPDAAKSLQAEPEIGLACDVRYGDDGLVEALIPFAFGACNDCSIRLPGAAKISQKKNWGANSKGVARRFLPIGAAGLEQATASFRLACFLRREGEIHVYGIDSPLTGYSYYGDRLLGWIVDRMRNQQGGPNTPLEPIGNYLRACSHPSKALITIGATRYTPFGESTYLDPGDESIVVAYDAAEIEPDDIAGALDRDDARLTAESVLTQTIG